jgi:AbrB family looped-hinge helix DNA binding protein
MAASATLTSKGQLVIPSAIRKALHMQPGTRFAVSLDGNRIVLEPTAPKTRRLADWLPGLQVRRKATRAALVAPVDGYDQG